jgi:mono/diheme cytochrome c family protein
MRRSTVACFLLTVSSVLFAAAFYSSFPVKPAQASSKSERELGATVFHEKGCEHCHGVDGIGTDRGPGLGSVGRKLRPVQIEKQIHDGGAQMPAFGDALTSDEIRQLVVYLSAKKKKSVKAAIAPASSAK